MAALKTIGIIGAGQKGTGLAERVALEGYDVILVDTKPDFIDQAVSTIRARLEATEARSIYRYPESPDDILARIHATCDSTQLVDATLVVECLPDDWETKHDTLRRLGQICPKETVFVTSANACRVADMAKGLSSGSRLVGLHLSAEPAENRLMEIIAASAEPRAFRLLQQMAHGIGGIVIESADSPGFVVKRLAAALFSEAVRILNEGSINAATIDAGVQAAFGSDKGPFALMNDMGIANAERYANGLAGKLPPLYQPPERLRAQCAANEPWPLDGEIDQSKRDEVKERVEGLAILVGTTIADEDVATPEDVNLGAKYGFDQARGPFDIINELGIPRAMTLASKTAEAHQLPVPQNIVSKTKKHIDTWSLEHVQLKIKEDTAVITIRRPDTRNGLDDVVVAQLESALKAAEKNDSVNKIVFTGIGDTLASGPTPAFLAEKIEADAVDGIIALHRRIHALFARIAASPKTTIAWTRGLTMGGGFELGLACRYLVAGSRAFFAFQETGLGIHPGLGATQRLPRKAGKSIGKYVIMTGETLTASAAERLGIVDAIVDDIDHIGLLLNNLGQSETLADDDIVPNDDELKAIALFNPANCAKTLAGDIPTDHPATKRVKEALSKAAPVALTLVNKLIDDGLGLEMAKAMEFELNALGLILGTQDALKGLKAGGSGASPTFTGE